ncbi:MAG: NAD(P)/FAD-dependent oxidoreductase [Gemmatimonadales bacterium]
MTEPFEAAIIGAGVVGLAAARALSLLRRRVVVLDRGPPGGEASGASAGMLASQIEAHAGSALLRFGIEGRERHLALAAECSAAGHSYPISMSGISVVALGDARATELQAQVLAQRALGLNTEWLSREDLVKRQPGISREARGAFCAPSDGWVDNVALCASLAKIARAKGATFATDRVVAVEPRDHVQRVHTAEAEYEARIVVIAAGAWSGGIEGVRHPFPVEPVRGQMAEIAWPRGEPSNVLYGADGYIVPRICLALLGSTTEHVGFEKRTTEEGLEHIRREAAAILPALATVPFTRTWSGLRPMTPDGLPILGFDPDVPGLLYATGHGRNGMLLGPISGEIVRDLVVRGETKWDISAYSIQRFGA